ncbi:MAG: DNA polymerase III subunit gamma/tau [Tannerellaceae bacterium]|jgi:DNA polymerase-3 subunit gamma/tau|nr:DNA polymerase III subunit gamma/tau [Tannerellaceae bacterium]
MENYIVSARKYRPSTFRSVVGQKSLTKTLKSAISTHKLAHAYLFCGPRGVGKTSCARIFAKAINCLTPTEDGEACNECESCSAFNEQRSYNIHELDAASNNSVNDIRTLIEQVRIPPAISKYKVFIIDEVHMLSTQAFNAFLKTLEEPPRHALFILATTEKHKVLPTILSRCQTYDFTRISIADIVEHLEYVASQENIQAEAEALNIIAQKADGGMRDALSIFDQIAGYSDGKITYQSTIYNLNVLDYEYYFRLTETMLEGNVRQAMLILNEILSNGFDGQNIITGLGSHFRDLLMCRDESTIILFEVGASIRERYKEIAKRCSESFLFKAIELANNCDLNYRASRNKRLLLELTMIQLCQLILPHKEDNSKKKRLIEPLTHPDNQNSAQQEQSPSAAPSSSAPPATAPKVSRLQPMISVKNIGKEEPKEAEKAQPEMREQDKATPFTDADLLKFWNTYAEAIEENAYLKGTMTNIKPVLLDNCFFEVYVHNTVQQDELISECSKLLSYLREKLNNNLIQMTVRVCENAEKKKAYTPAEKYQHLININPVLARLKDEFHLTGD